MRLKQIVHHAQIERVAIRWDVRGDDCVADFMAPRRRCSAVPEKKVVAQLVQRGRNLHLGRGDEVDLVPQTERDHDIVAWLVGDA